MVIEEFNIQPKASILGAFSRLNYKPQYAIGEFVDNSTASFFGHKKQLLEYGITKVRIDIEYDAYENTLTITDNAYGMDRSDFNRAILLDQKPDNLNGRNEFGMGLKTAASWFGNVWSVRSSQLGSNTEYYAEIDINSLKENDSNTIKINSINIDLKSHYTIIKISKITKKIKQIKRIKDLLGWIYRRDINSGDVDIYFNGEKILFEPLDVLEFRNNKWKKDINFTVDYDNKKYNVSGFVGIMEKGSFPKAGFTLFRYNRAIIGGLDANYKPPTIFGQPQSQISLKLFGELNMEDFPVNQAKDGFAWDEGLEEEFVVKLKEEIKEYISIASISKKDRVDKNEISNERSKNVEEDVQKSFNGIVLDDDSLPLEKEDNNISEKNIVDLYRQQQRKENETVPAVFSSPREYNIQLDRVTTKRVAVSWKVSNSDEWISYNSEKCEVIININHPFFKPFSIQIDFQKILESFVIAFVCAEELAKKASRDHEGYMLPDTFRNKMNFILKQLSKDK